MPDTVFFSPELFEFMRQLKRHNNREWFAKNKQRYEAAVRDPALLFINGFAPHLHKLSPNFVADARPTRGSLFRIYRDTRFASDKTPFKTHVGIHFSHASGKDAHAPVFYLHLEPDGCFAAAGVWHPDSSVLTKIRSAIIAEPALWAKAKRKLEIEGDSSQAPAPWVRPQSPIYRRHQTQGFRGFGCVYGKADLRRHVHARLRRRLPHHAAAGGVYDPRTRPKVLDRVLILEISSYLR